MCGIAGLFHTRSAAPVDSALIEAMTDTLAHRGPDGAGVWTAPGIGLGHRRLSIIDLGGGAQPMFSADGRIGVTYNGEIYNFAAVKEELKALGHSFRTDSDTEVILEAWREWREDCLSRFNGMFAFALYDADAASLFLARDRFGVKPLFYAELDDGALIFASELKGILAHPRLPRILSPQAVEDYLTLGYVPDDACIIEGVRKLPAGHHLTLRRGSAVPEPICWWNLEFTGDASGTVEDLGAELIDKMRAAVRSRMVADVPLGAFLSGGVDSSAVVAMMSETSREPVQTCSIGFDEAAFDETRYSDLVADRFGTRHRRRTVRADDFSLVDTLVEAFDEPFADPSALPTYRVCELARETVKVSLSGDGADEAFAGYRRYHLFKGEEAVRGAIPGAIRQPLFGALGRLYPRADWAPRFARLKPSFEKLARAKGCTGPVLTSTGMRNRIYSPAMKRALQGHQGEDRYISALETAPAEDAVSRAQYADFKIYLPGDILTKLDRTSMAVSLEAREPMLDHRLVEFAARLPTRMRLNRGVGKWLMKRSLETHLPPEILYRRKMGFQTPITAWFRGALAEEAANIAKSSALSETGWFDSDEISRVAAQHRAGAADHGYLLWQLLILDKALRRLFGMGSARTWEPARQAVGM